MVRTLAQAALIGREEGGREREREREREGKCLDAFAKSKANRRTTAKEKVF